MKLKKKLGTLGLVTALCMSMVVGCGSTNDTAPSNNSDSNTASDAGATTDASNGDVVTVRVWGAVPEEAGPLAVVEAFNKEFAEEGIQAEYVRFVNDQTGNLQLETALMSGEGVDVFTTYDRQAFGTRVEANMVLDITASITDAGLDLYEDFGGDLGTSYRIDGVDYGIPTKADLYGMMINMDMFQEAGIEIPTEWTLSEFREIAKQLTHGEGQDKVYGAFLNTSQDMMGPMGYMGVSATGGDWMYKKGSDTETNFDHPVVQEMYGTVTEMMNVDESIPTHTDTVTQNLSQEGMFLTGKAAMTIGPWIVRSVKDLENYPHDFKTAFAPYPTTESGEILYSQGGAGDVVAISAKSKNVDAAWKYLEWYATEGMVHMASGGRVPLYSAYNLDEVAEAFIGEYVDLIDFETTKSVLIETRENFALSTKSTKSAELRQILEEELEAVFTEQKGIEEGLADAKERGDKLLSE